MGVVAGGGFSRRLAGEIVNDVVVLIPSCDSFSDCHPAALTCLEKYWPDCPWRIVTTSVTKPWGPNCVLTKTDRGWVENLSAVLELCDFEFVLTFLEDMLLCRQVDTAACITAANDMTFIKECGGIRLGQGAEKCHHTTLVGGYGVVSPDSPYRISTSPTLWRVSYLRKILADCGSTAWDFEVIGTQRSRDMPEEIWVQAGEGDVHRAFRVFYTGITRGKWNRGCLNWLKEIGVEQPDISRGVIEENDGRPM